MIKKNIHARLSVLGDNGALWCSYQKSIFIVTQQCSHHMVTHTCMSSKLHKHKLILSFAPTLMLFEKRTLKATYKAQSRYKPLHYT